MKKIFGFFKKIFKKSNNSIEEQEILSKIIKKIKEYNFEEVQK